MAEKKQRLVMATADGTGEVAGQARQIGSQSRETPVIRELLREMCDKGRYQGAEF